MNSAVIEILAPRYQIAWYPWAVQYFFMIALAYASLWLALPGLLGAARWKATARFAMLGAMTTAIVAPIALLADLHQPLRFWHFYAYFTPWSWMSIGSLMLPPFVFAIIAIAWLVWREPMLAWRERDDLFGMIARLVTLGNWQTPRILVVSLALATTVLSLGIAVYTGSEVAIVKGRPLWNTVWLLPFFATTGLIGAGGLVLLLARIAGPRDPDTARNMLWVISAAAVATAGVALMWVLEGLYVENSSVAAALRSVRHSGEWRSTSAWGLGVGTALTLGCLVLLSRKPQRGWSWIVGLVALHLAWMARWVVLMDVQTVQKQTAGYLEYTVGWGSSGWLGVVGTFGLWIALILVIDMLVPWRGALGGTAADAPDTTPDYSAKGAASHG